LKGNGCMILNAKKKLGRVLYFFFTNIYAILICTYKLCDCMCNIEKVLTLSFNGVCILNVKSILIYCCKNS
jgi:hypothetical protein